MKLRSRGKFFVSSSVLLISFGSSSCFSVSSRTRHTRSTRDEGIHLLKWPSGHQKKLLKRTVRFSILSSDAEPNFNVDAPSVEEEQSNVTASVSSEPPLSTERSRELAPTPALLDRSRPDSTRCEKVAFAVPAIGVWLCSPLLSLIDTSSVGLLAGTAQQAALNPAVAVTDYSARLLSFLFTGTTHMVAVAQEADRDVEGKPETAKAFRGALQLSVMVGAGVGSILLLFARPLLKGIIGNDAIDPEVFGAAMKYVRIRSLGMPAAAAIGTAQAACLGMQDIHSPLYVILVAAVVNLVMDLLLVGRPQMWIGGAAGAAWATMFSQYIAMGLFFKWLCQKPEPAKLDLNNRNPLTRLAPSIPALVKKTETGFWQSTALERTTTQPALPKPSSLCPITGPRSAVALLCSSGPCRRASVPSAWRRQMLRQYSIPIVIPSASRPELHGYFQSLVPKKGHPGFNPSLLKVLLQSLSPALSLPSRSPYSCSMIRQSCPGASDHSCPLHHLFSTRSLLWIRRYLIGTT
jgi:hypothetical protein